MDISAMLSSLSSSDYISIGGGILVIAVAIFIFRSGPKKEKTKETEPELHTEEPVVTEQGKSKLKVKIPGISLDFKWKEKMQFLKSIRSRSNKKVEAQEEEVLIPDILMEDPDMEIAIPVQEVYHEQSNLQEEEIVMAETTEEYADDDVIPSLELEEVEYDETALEVQEYQVEDDETEEEEEVDEVVSAEPAHEKSPDDIFSMFTEDENEESEVSKFAATLDAVDIDDLMTEVQDLKKYMRR